MAKTSGNIRGGDVRQRVMSEEQYLASMGYGRAGFGDVALAKGNIVTVQVVQYLNDRIKRTWSTSTQGRG